MALSMIVGHVRGKEWTHVFGNKFAQGLAGYEAWIKVMKLRRADEHGNAYNLAVVGDAAVHYEAVAAAFGQLRERFPFPDGGQPKDPDTADLAEQLLQQAQEAETKGVEQLEQLFHFINRGVDTRGFSHERKRLVLLVYEHMIVCNNRITLSTGR